MRDRWTYGICFAIVILIVGFTFVLYRRASDTSEHLKTMRKAWQSAALTKNPSFTLEEYVARAAAVEFKTEDTVDVSSVLARSKMSLDLLAAIDAGGNDRHRVIVQVVPAADMDQDAALAAVHEFAAEQGSAKPVDIPIINATVLDLPASGLLALGELGSIARLSLDAPVRGCAFEMTQAIGADQVWDTLGYTADDVRVVVLDSGVDKGHDDMEFPKNMSYLEELPRQVLLEDLEDTLDDFYPPGDCDRKDRMMAIDFVDGPNEGFDKYGHGTHVSGIIAGNAHESRDSNNPDGYSGVAPEATILHMRVLDNVGAGYTSDVLAAISFVVTHQDLINARVMNVSLGHPVFESYETDPLALACAVAVEAGIAVVCSAGNNGYANGQEAYGTISSPGHAPWVITVGATDTKGTGSRADDSVALFSSRGPTAVDGLMKPDLVAPGTNLISCRPRQGCYISDTYSQQVDAGDYHYMKMSGTSMAAAVVSGALALLFDANPSLTPSGAKAILMYTAEKMTTPDVYSQGCGSLNIEGAVRLAEAIRQDSDTLAVGSSWLTSGTAEGALQPYTDIAGQRAYWGSTILWGDGYLWYSGPGNGTDDAIWGDGFLWDDVLNWANGHLWYDSLVGEKQEVFGECFLWYTGCSGGTNGTGWNANVLQSQSMLWSDPGLFNTWSGAFVDPSSISGESTELVLAAGDSGSDQEVDYGEEGDWFFPVPPNSSDDDDDDD